MWKNFRRSVLCILPALLVLLSLMACKPDDKDAGSKPFPIVDDPDMEINVTPKPETDMAYFTITVERVGLQAPNVGWYANGEIYVSVPIELSDEPDAEEVSLLSGVGFGRAGFDASSNVCVDIGGWPVEYTAEGMFDAEKCEMNLKIVETWPSTEAYATCFGQSGSASGGEYKMEFPSLKFVEDDTREDTTTDRDMLVWANTFKLYPKEGLEDTGCLFDAPAGDQ